MSLTEKEKQLIGHHVDFYRALDEGTRRPNTQAQLHFVKVCRGQATANTPHELAYIKWKRQQLQEARIRYKTRKDSGGIPEHEEGWPVDEFGSRDDYKRDRGRTWNNNLRNKL